MPLKLELPASDGRTHSTKDHRGRVALLVYESPTGGSTNKAVKDALERRIAENPALAEKFALIPIANLSSIPAMAPIQQIAMSQVQEEAKKMKCPIWVDWTGAVGKALKLTADSNFVVLDKEGNIAKDWIGKMSPNEIVDLLATLQTLDAS